MWLLWHLSCWQGLQAREQQRSKAPVQTQTDSPKARQPGNLSAGCGCWQAGACVHLSTPDTYSTLDGGTCTAGQVISRMWLVKHVCRWQGRAASGCTKHTPSNPLFSRPLPPSPPPHTPSPPPPPFDTPGGLLCSPGWSHTSNAGRPIVDKLCRQTGRQGVLDRRCKWQAHLQQQLPLGVNCPLHH